ncbi:uncharacterized protein LOC143293559 isoform X1 [Babylonia areolata]|uniref:uncharacterized protein LOC143293559 isoform X1 n=1 Tax=Babylonia areolata TaxID=304850 RepID=UPI003FD3BF5D
MEKKEEAAAQFINALIKSVQTLCHGYLEFQNGIEIIGHINLSVDKGGSLDYILKEKVCRNAENSTLFISNSFYAESKAEEITQRRYSPLDSNAGPDVAMAQREGSKLASAISSISSSLSREKHKRGSDGRESHSSHKGSKRRSSQDHSEGHPAKVTHMLPESMHSGRGSSPVRSRGSLQGLGSPDGAASETLLPQTASVGDGSGIGVNLAGSVLEPVGNQNESDLARRDDDSDGDLEVTFIKEEYGQGDSSAGDFDSSGGHQFGGGSSLRDGSRFPVGLHDSSAGFMPGSFDQGAQYSPSDIASTSQPGPSGIRGVSGIQSFVNSLSAFGSLGAPGLPLSQIGASAGPSRQNRMGGLPKSQRGGSAGYSKSHSSLQRAFALHREDKRRKQEGVTSDEDMKQRLELMTELLTLKGISSTEDYKAALLREKRRLAKKLYRASLPEEKKNEIKEKDKLHKRLKRATRWAASESMTDTTTQHFSDCSSDMTSQKDFDNVPRTSSGFGGSFTAVGSVSMGGLHDKDQGGGGGNASRHSSDSSRVGARPGSGPSSEENMHGMGSEPLSCDTGMGSGSAGLGSGSAGSIPRLGSSCLSNIPRICSTSAAHVQVGTDPMESFASARPGSVSSSSMVFGSVGSVPWMDPVSFDTSSQEHRHMDHGGGQREGGYNLMKLGQR